MEAKARYLRGGRGLGAGSVLGLPAAVSPKRQCSVEPCSMTQALPRRKKDRRSQLVGYSVVDRLLVRGVSGSSGNGKVRTMRISKQLDAEFKYMRGSGTRRHREMCAANAQSPNVPTATGREPRCKVCEAKLAAELRG